MPLAAILAGISIAEELFSFFVHQAELSRQAGEITPEQLEAVKTRSGLSIAEWDAEVEKAKAIIAARGGG